MATRAPLRLRRSLGQSLLFQVLKLSNGTLEQPASRNFSAAVWPAGHAKGTVPCGKSDCCPVLGRGVPCPAPVDGHGVAAADTSRAATTQHSFSETLFGLAKSRNLYAICGGEVRMQGYTTRRDSMAEPCAPTSPPPRAQSVFQARHSWARHPWSPWDSLPDLPSSFHRWKFGCQPAAAASTARPAPATSLPATLGTMIPQCWAGQPRDRYPLAKRTLSNLPEDTIYGGPRESKAPEQAGTGAGPSQAKRAAPPKRVTLRVLEEKYHKKEPITMVTAYDYPSAVHVDQAGIDICLVGDSVAMVVHGHDTTLPVTLEDMLLHCRAVSRGARRPLLVGDLPFGSYEQSSAQAVDSAVQFLKRGGMDAVKIEGGIPARVAAARAIVEAGIAVMGHVGLTPQAISSLGGFRPQGRSAKDAVKVVEHALALEEAGCFAIILECVPAVVGDAITRATSVPTIGIGAGPFCSGQVLVYHDLLGMMQHPHHAKVTPKFCKQFGKVGEAVQLALNEYKEEVSMGRFPSEEYSPYKMAPGEEEEFLTDLENCNLPLPDSYLQKQ